VNPFYVVILIIGILLTLVCISLIFYYRKRFLAIIKLANKKEQQLTNIISNADLMIDELNKFSDLIINEIEKKNLDFKNVTESYQNEIKNINRKVESLKELLNDISESLEMQKNKIINNEDKSKSIPLNSKYSEVIRLFNEGVDETEIARQLNMGKGEVQLILQFVK
jgi:DNA-binding NarL/FixJ family response regulator